MINFFYYVLDKADKEKHFKIRLKLYKYLTIAANVYLKIRYDVFGKLGGKPGISKSGKDDLIISLTTFPARIKTVHLTINTLLNQTVKPDRIILWCSDEQFDDIEKLPKRLLRLRKRGLEIRFCSDDLKGHKKYFYTLKEFPNAKIITVDDDAIYPNYLVEKLINKSKEFPNCIICNRGHEITKSDGKIQEYKDWVKEAVYLQKPTYSLCPTGVGGVLYPQKCLDDEIVNVENLKKCALSADDLWLHAMAVKKGTKAVYTEQFPQWLFLVGGSQKETLAQTNVHNNHNDIVLRNILSEYEINI